MIAVGFDGAKGGWMAVALAEDGVLQPGPGD